MEILDLYDENNNLTGDKISRGEPSSTGYIMLSVIIIENNQKLLIQQGSKSKNEEYGLTGGHVLSGETPLDAIIRETKEELGITLNKDNIKFIGYEKHPSVKAIFAIYYTNQKIEKNDITIQDEEVQNIIWVSTSEIKNFIENNNFKSSHAYVLKKVL